MIRTKENSVKIQCLLFVLGRHYPTKCAHTPKPSFRAIPGLDWTAPRGELDWTLSNLALVGIHSLLPALANNVPQARRLLHHYGPGVTLGLLWGRHQKSLLSQFGVLFFGVSGVLGGAAFVQLWTLQESRGSSKDKSRKVGVIVGVKVDQNRRSMLFAHTTALALAPTFLRVQNLSFAAPQFFHFLGIAVPNRPTQG